MPIDVNKANVFELMTIRGLGQELAAAIVSYRDRRGDFFSIGDLLKVIKRPVISMFVILPAK